MNSNRTREKLIKQLAKVRDRKIKRIKSKISSGKYHVDATELAKALIMAN